MHGLKMRLAAVLIVLALGAAAAVVVVPLVTHMAGESGEESFYYTCPMHPSVISDRPGDCPICGMSLVKKEREPAEHTTLAEVTLSPRQRMLANVATSVAEIRQLEKRISTVGRFDVDEQRLAHVSAWIGGRVERLYVDFTGAVVQRGQPLLDIYSPALIQTQEEYLSTIPREGERESATLRSARERLRAAARQRLLLWGITEAQINELERSRTAQTVTTIYAPASGTVMRKMVHEGMYVQQGQTLFDIADLTTIWMYADVYEYELPFLKKEQEVLVYSDAHPGRTFRGRITFIDPVLDPGTRTVSVRAEFRNPDGSLKPGMFGRAEVRVPTADLLVVPASAVVNTGERQVVWVEVEPNRFVPHHVVPGYRIDDWYQILEGLEPGAIVASSGGFLLDSESQLKAMAGGAGLHAAMGHEQTTSERGESAHEHTVEPPGR